MKEFVKVTLATVTGLIIFGIISLFLTFGLIVAMASLGEKQPVMPAQGILKIDMSTMMLAEQTTEADPFASLSGSTEPIAPVGIYSAIKAINAAATDPAVKCLYLKPDGVSGLIHRESKQRKHLSRISV